MIKIIAITTHGGMVIGKEYEVGAGIASILVQAGRCKYLEPVETPIAEKPKAKRKK